MQLESKRLNGDMAVVVMVVVVIVMVVAWGGRLPALKAQHKLGGDHTPAHRQQHSSWLQLGGKALMHQINLACR